MPFVWFSYIAHQVAAWLTQYYAQARMKNEDGEAPKYSTTLRRFNFQMLAVHGFFHGLHLVQTHTTYDGLHGDVSFQSSQASVIALLGVVFAMEAPGRGMFLGIPSHRGLSKAGLYVARKYHGYFFNWAAIWTFWCHPMEPMWGFLLGFSHTGLLMLQGSLMYTDAHKNRYWRFVLESWVTLHASIIAKQTMPGWEMFFFGFMLLFCAMQVPGLPFMRDMHIIIRLAPLVCYIAGLAGWWAVTRGGGGNVAVMGLLGIPIAEWLVAYGVTFVFWCIFHPKLGIGRGSSKVGGVLIFLISTALVAIFGALDWYIPYNAWLADPTVTPKGMILSYPGTAIALIGMVWGMCMLLGGPPKELYSSAGCCADCCGAVEEDDETAAKGQRQVEMIAAGSAAAPDM